MGSPLIAPSGPQTAYGGSASNYDQQHFGLAIEYHSLPAAALNHQSIQRKLEEGREEDDV
jgi:hypothetical protein